MLYPDQRSFAKGELSPQAAARADLAAYDAGAARIENFIVQVTGGVTRSPGTRYVATTKHPARASILVPFVFSTRQAYMIELGDRYARFYMNGGQILSGGVPYEIETPWTDAEVGRVSWIQEADIVYLFHPDHAPRKLSRTGHTQWTLDEVALTDGPFRDENIDKLMTVQASAVTGSAITVTASHDLFQAGHVGALFRLGETDPNGVQPWESGKSYSLDEQARFDGAIYVASAKNGDAGTVPPVHREGAAWDGRSTTGTQWTYLHDGYGRVRITGFISPRSVTAEVLTRLPDSVVSAPTWRWAEGAWSDARGYPGTATFADQRLIAAAGRDQPMTFWGSGAAGNYESFEDGPEADKSFRYTLAARQVNAIAWVVNAPVVLIGTPEAVWAATGRDFEAPVTAIDIRARPVAREGSALVPPVTEGPAVLMVSRAGTRVLELTHDGGRAGYGLRDLTILAEHISLGDPA